jgi:hypothetical protein
MRIIIATVASSFIASVAFGQMKYSRPRSQSPTPTPTPAPSATPTQSKPVFIPAQKTAPPTRSPMPQRMMPASTQLRPPPTPAPIPPRMTGTPPASQLKPMFIPSQKAGQVPTPSSTPLQRTMSFSRPTPAPLPRTAAVPQTAPVAARTTSTSFQSKPTPTLAPLQPKLTASRQPIQAKPTPALALIPPKVASTPAPPPARPTATPVPPPDVSAYLDRQLANSKDKRFHMTVNGKDLAFTPFHVWAQKSTGVDSTSTCIDMRGDDGRIYDIDFLTTGAQLTVIRIHRINGEAVR